MKLHNFSQNTIADVPHLPASLNPEDELFILCRTHEVAALRNVFGFDESTVLDCTDLDESVRYSCFDGYDFISLVHIETLDNELILREINLYVSAKYLVLVMPEHDSSRLEVMEQKLLAHAANLEDRPARINNLYFMVFHYLLSDFSDTLEALEDRMQELSEKIVNSVEKGQFSQINSLRNMAYTAKKQLRALSYSGDQILLDENHLIGKKQLQYFRNLSTRFKKLYDFAESLYELSGEMLYTFDSRMSIKTNDTINKLTVLTLFFGPLTVITGIYGMNFDRIPELHWPWGYPLALIAMAAVTLILYLVLKKKRWL